jgi:hypothetical protein
MGMVKIKHEIVEAVLAHALELAQRTGAAPADTAASVLAAGALLLSSGMNDEQVRAMLDQAFDFSANVRRDTEARWKKTGFDPYAGERKGSAS